MATKLPRDRRWMTTESLLAYVDPDRLLEVVTEAVKAYKDRNDHLSENYIGRDDHILVEVQRHVWHEYGETPVIEHKLEINAREV